MRQQAIPSLTRRATIGTAMALALLSTAARAETPTPWRIHDLQRPKPPVITPGQLALPVAPPSDAVVLFDGNDLAHWRSEDGQPPRWVARDGYFESVPNSGYLFTADAFGDIQLHLEWAAPLPAKGRSQGRGNSGVFLMGLYEVQILDSFENETYADGQAAAIYGQSPPLVNACLPPGEWQSYDIVFRRPRFAADGTLQSPARLTVIHNGVLVQDAFELWGPTAWLTHLPYQQHADRLPLSLQDHGNPVRFRNVWLRPLDESGGPTRPDAAAATQTTTREQLAKYVGRYGSPLGEFGRIELAGEQLQLVMETGQTIDLVATSPTDFAFSRTAARLAFDVDAQGQVNGFTMHLAGDRYPIRRQAEK